FLAYVGFTSLGLPFGIAFALALAAAAAIGALIYLVVVRQAKTTSDLGLIILTLGLALALGGFDALVFGTDNKVVPTLAPDTIARFAGASFSVASPVTASLGTVPMLALWALLTYTRLRASTCPQDPRPDVAEAVGLHER